MIEVITHVPAVVENRTPAEVMVQSDVVPVGTTAKVAVVVSLPKRPLTRNVIVSLVSPYRYGNPALLD